MDVARCQKGSWLTIVSTSSLIAVHVSRHPPEPKYNSNV